MNGLWVGIPALLAVFLFGSMRLRSDYKINVALLCLAGVIGIYLVEFALILTNWKRPGVLWGMDVATRKREIVSVAAKFGVDFDTRTKVEVLSAMRQKGIDAVPAINPLNLLKPDGAGGLKSRISVDGREILPLGGIADKLTILCNETGTYAMYHSDERGFSNPRGIWNSTPLEIAAVGDSFTQGACVSSEKNFVGLVRARYPATLNLGMSGNGSLLMLAGIREYLTALKPKIVLWFYFEENDLDELAGESRSSLLLRYLEDGFTQNLTGLQPEIDKRLAGYVERELAREIEKQESTRAVSNPFRGLARVLKLTRLRRGLGLRGEASEREEWRRIELFGKVLSRANVAVAQWSGKLYFVYLPSWRRYGAPSSARPERDRVLAVVSKLGIPIIDMHPVFQAESNPLSLFPFGRFGHYNEKGHALVAAEVLRTIAVEAHQPNGPDSGT